MEIETVNYAQWNTVQLWSMALPIRNRDKETRNSWWELANNSIGLQNFFRPININENENDHRCWIIGGDLCIKKKRNSIGQWCLHVRSMQLSKYLSSSCLLLKVKINLRLEWSINAWLLNFLNCKKEDLDITCCYQRTIISFVRVTMFPLKQRELFVYISLTYKNKRSNLTQCLEIKVK